MHCMVLLVKTSHVTQKALTDGLRRERLIVLRKGDISNSPSNYREETAKIGVMYKGLPRIILTAFHP